jgi:hypothetical protein
MDKLIQVLKKHRLPTITFAAIGLGVLSGILAWSGMARRRQAVGPTVKSKTSAVRVLGAEKTTVGTMLVLAVRLQNTSAKDVQAYTIGSGKSWMTTNYFVSEEAFASGATINHLIPLSDDDSQSLNAFGKSTGTFYVNAVVFTDGTVDGDASFARMLADERTGTRDQAKRILPSLQALSSAAAPERERALADFEAKIQSLPEKGERPATSAYENGLAIAKRGLLSRLAEIREHLRSGRPNEAAASQEKMTRVFQRLAQTP